MSNLEPQNDLNTGGAGTGTSGAADAGGQGANPGSNSQPANQNGSQPTNWEVEARKHQAEVRRLNEALITARRGGQQGNGQNDGGDPFGSVEGKYGAALRIAEADVRGGLEGRLSFYPEIPADLISQIRKNPWAFVRQENYLKADAGAALDDIETFLLEKANEISAQNGGNQGSQGGQTSKNPANINSNPAPDLEAEADPGSEEDTNPWTMPMDKLAKVKNRELKKINSQKG